MWIMPQSQPGHCDIDHSAHDSYSSGCTKVRIGFPVTAELSSTTRERLRGVLVDARLGVTGKGYGAHGLSGRRPQRELNLPAMIERGSTIRGRLRGHAPGFPEVGVRA
jgi:hypothetical protein